MGGRILSTLSVLGSQRIVRKGGAPETGPFVQILANVGHIMVSAGGGGSSPGASGPVWEYKEHS